MDSAALTLHMSIMRKSFRNIIKSKYKDLKKEYLASYDYIHEEVKQALLNNSNSYDLNLNIRDLEILNEFLRAYTNKVMNEFNEQLQDTDREQIEALNDVHRRCNELLMEIH